jgi:hypothetical protein
MVRAKGAKRRRNALVQCPSLLVVVDEVFRRRIAAVDRLMGLTRTCRLMSLLRRPMLAQSPKSTFVGE